MSLYVIADLHLSTANEAKSMEVFGRRWSDYVQKIKTRWNALVTPQDTVVIPGDITWAMTLEQARSDFAFLDSLPGQKLLGKGNHDFWWLSASKMQRFFSENSFNTLSLLYNNACYTQGAIIAGTRGWFWEEDAQPGRSREEIKKLLNRESVRLQLSLSQAAELKLLHPEAPVLAFLHFPPVWNGEIAHPLVSQLQEAGVKDCYFGHIHGNYLLPATFSACGITFHMAAADYLQFTPLYIPVSGRNFQNGT